MKAPFVLALMCVNAALCLAQTPPAPLPANRPGTTGRPDLARLMHEVEKPHAMDPAGPEDSPRLGMLIKDGAIYLSLHDAIQLALENNLDIAAGRLLRPIADSDMKRAAAGELLRNVPLGTVNGPASASGPLAVAGASGYESGFNSQSGVLSGLSIQLAGAQIPQLDPVFYATGLYSHTDQPEANRIVAGTNSLISQTQQWQAGVQKAFLTGTSFDLNFTSLRVSQNAPNDTINPAINADLALKVQQPVLQGGSRKANMRAIRIARNDQVISRITFEQQVSATISQVLTLYFDLVTFRNQLRVIEDALTESRKLLDRNRQQLAMGVISQADLIDSEAAVDANQQLVEDARIQVQQQEMILKTVLTRKGLENPVVLNVPIVPTDHFVIPDAGTPDEPLEVIAEQAVGQRSEVREADLELVNKRLSLLGTREALKPVLNVYMNLQTNALAGTLNRLATPEVSAGAPSQFLGGFGLALHQVGVGAYPDYAFGFQLNVPLENRAARADMMRDRIDLEEQQIGTQEMKNGIRLQAVRSALALRQARKQYEAGVRLRQLRQDNLDQQQKMFDLGTSSIGQIIEAQRELQLSQQQEITAYNTYAHAAVNLDEVLNETLAHNGVVLEDVQTGAPRQPQRTSRQ